MRLVEGRGEDRINLPRVEPAHVMVALHSSIHDCSIPLLADPFSSNIVVYPIWVSPTSRVYGTKFNLPACVIGNSLFECRIEHVVIEENIRVVEPPVEVSLYRLHGLYDPFQFLIPRQDHERCVGTRAVGLRFETASDEDLVVFLADLPVDTRSISISKVTGPYGEGGGYLIDGGAPAGIRMPPVDDGCRTTSTSMSIITMHGKRSTAPRGMDIFELPFSRIRRRKKANLGDRRSVSPDKSLSEGRFGDDGIRFKIFWTSPIDADSQQLRRCTVQTCWALN